MELWEWAVLCAFVAGLAVILAIRVLRRTSRGRAILGLSMREKARFGQELLRDPYIPLPAKLLSALLVGYLVLPLDLIPDFVPFVGHLDDLAVTVVVVAIVLRLVPSPRIDRAIAIARQQAAIDVTPQRMELPPGRGFQD